MRDIAAEVGCHYTTVALALKDSPKVAAETKRAVQEKAAEMGYRPDPYLSALNAYRRRNGDNVFKATIAWLDNHPEKEGSLAWPGFREFLEGAKDRARRFGYEIDYFWMHEPRMTNKRLVSILRARNIQGLILPPQPNDVTHFEFDWKHFCAVALGFTIQTPKLPIVSNYHYRSILKILEELENLGYKRIGLDVLERMDERLCRAVTGAYLTRDLRLQEEDRVPILMEKGDYHNPDLIKQWIDEHKPEVVISNNDHLHISLSKKGYKIPEEIGVVYINVEKDSEISGIYQNCFKIGQAAVDLLDGMLRRSELGLQEVPPIHLIEGEWNPGTTVRKIR